MQVKKYYEGSHVVFEWDGSNQLGIVNAVFTRKGQPRKYEIISEAGRLYPPIGVDTTAMCPGKILSGLTEKFFNGGLKLVGDGED